jgi:hypothetical protein
MAMPSVAMIYTTGRIASTVTHWRSNEISVQLTENEYRQPPTIIKENYQIQSNDFFVLYTLGIRLHCSPREKFAGSHHGREASPVNATHHPTRQHLLHHSQALSKGINTSRNFATAMLPFHGECFHRACGDHSMAGYSCRGGHKPNSK